MVQIGEWKTKEGRTIRICDMTNAHLFNTLLFIQKYTNEKRKDKPFINEVRPIFWCLLDEAEERGIIDKVEDLNSLETENLRMRIK